MIDIIHGDNVTELTRLQAEGTKAKLVYADPPFYTQTTQKAKAGQYSDKWPSLKAYLSQLELVADLSRNILLPEGTLWLHCDWRTSHYVRHMLDEVFGPGRFRNEVIWSYRRWPSRSRFLQRMHDTIFVYAKGSTPTFNTIYRPPTASTLKATGVNRVFGWAEDGKRKQRTTSTVSPGAPISDVWDDIPIIAPSAKERTGYPTQKPERLLERIIAIATDRGDLVIDPYCGSGTTVSVCSRMGRGCITVDSNIEAIGATHKRLAMSVLRAS